MSAAPVIQIEGLTVRYGFRTAVSGLNLRVERGAAVGLLGANGAGKTTTLNALLGFLRPKEGGVSLFGEGPAKPKLFRRIGFAPDDGSPPDYLTGREYLKFVSSYRIADAKERTEAVDRWLDWFELDPSKKVGGYSRGMRRRIALAQALVGKPELVVLDEPLNGLDPLFIIKLREGLEKYLKEGGTLLFSSHILSEVEKICNEVAIVAKGKLRAQSPVAQLNSQYGSVENAFRALTESAAP